MPSQLQDLFIRLWLKIKELLASAKFWTLVMSVSVSGQLYAEGKITALQFLIAVITSTSVYMGAKAYEDSHTRAA